MHGSSPVSYTHLDVYKRQLLLWLLPWAYNFAFYKPERTPFTLWSCVVGDFAVVDFAGDGIVRRDRGGRTYTDREFDSILPTFYARQLLNDERFPDSLCGVAVTPRLLQSENFMFRSTPAEINKPRTGLYPVSYTHLEVYKRQVKKTRSFVLMFSQ